MGIPVEKDLVGVEQVERRESDGTVVQEGSPGEGHARDVPIVNVAKKGKGLLERITGVAP